LNQSNQPLVSVVIACYNHEFFVQDSIQSVIDQTYQNIELIIIDDGSKDGSVEKIQEMIPTCQKRFIRFEFRYRPNKGLSATLNEALEWCEGEYYAGFASDDIMLNDKTDIQVRFLNDNKDVVAVFGGVKLIDEKNIEVGILQHSSTSYSFKEIIMHEHDLPAPTQLIRMSSLKNVGGYSPDILIEDWYMWLKLSNIGKIYYMNKIMSLYRRHETNTSGNLSLIHQGRIEVLNKFKNSKYYIEAYSKIEWLNFVENILASNQLKFLKYIRIFIYHPVRAIRFFLKLM